MKKQTFVFPKDWEIVICESLNEFCTSSFFQEKGEWLWQFNDPLRVIISDWKLCWKYKGKIVLKTIDEFLAMSSRKNPLSRMVMQPILPETWKQIIAKHPYKFNPRMIFQSDKKWLWQAERDFTIDISRWKIHWDIPGEGIVLKTMDEFQATHV